MPKALPPHRSIEHVAKGGSWAAELRDDLFGIFSGVFLWNTTTRVVSTTRFGPGHIWTP